MSKKAKTVVWICLILTLGFIWIHSMMSVEVSQEESLGFLAFIRPFLEVFFGKGNVTDHLVRKLAHFTEFTALGVELALLWESGWKRRICAAVCGHFAAFLDETIQIFSGRGCQVQDVWLDTAGVCFGVLLMIALGAWMQKNKKRST